MFVLHLLGKGRLVIRIGRSLQLLALKDFIGRLSRVGMRRIIIGLLGRFYFLINERTSRGFLVCRIRRVLLYLSMTHGYTLRKTKRIERVDLNAIVGRTYGNGSFTMTSRVYLLDTMSTVLHCQRGTICVTISPASGTRQVNSVSCVRRTFIKNNEIGVLTYMNYGVQRGGLLGRSSSLVFSSEKDSSGNAER